MQLKTTLKLMALAIVSTQMAQAQTQPPCTPSQLHISKFISVLPSAQPDSLRIPSTHTFQLLVQSGNPYTDTNFGVVKGLFDFTGYVPVGASSENGFIALNHEGGNSVTGGVSILDIKFDTTFKLWQVNNIQPVNFDSIGGTGRNCSGGVTPWNTSITSEETLPNGDGNGDGYTDVGWNVEIDPVTRAIKDYNGDGKPDKLWKMGRMSHENVVVRDDGAVLYQANDENPGYVFKFVPDTAGKLDNGKLYVLKLDGAINTVSVGSWVQIPNGTPTQCNNVRTAATSAGATNFNSLEDVEISPLDGMIYFTSKSSSRVYRFRDMGTTVADVEVFVGNPSTQFLIQYDSVNSAYEQWRDGNDNLTFDNLGNLYVIQDGGRNHIWMVSPCHTQANPDVKLFAVIPDGAEPTGMTFSPDYRFMFVSIQHPDAANATIMKDAADSNVVFNLESTIVIARKGFLGAFPLEDTTTPVDTTLMVANTRANTLAIANVYPNPTQNDVYLTVTSPAGQDAYIKVYSVTGAVVVEQKSTLSMGSNTLTLNTANLAPGMYNIVLTTKQGSVQSRLISNE